MNRDGIVLIHEKVTRKYQSRLIWSSCLTFPFTVLSGIYSSSCTNDDIRLFIISILALSFGQLSFLVTKNCWNLNSLNWKQITLTPENYKPPRARGLNMSSIQTLYTLPHYTHYNNDTMTTNTKNYLSFSLMMTFSDLFFLFDFYFYC